jgi:DNA-directed RNA polymerase subunit M
MIPKGGTLVCRKCGYEKKYEEKKDKYKSSVVSMESKKESDIIVIEGDVGVLPTTRAHCDKCGNNEAYWWMRQLRSADESETRFYRCTKCGSTWREYD